MVKLDSTPSRSLTDREVAKILNSVIGGLAQMTTEENLRTAMAFCTEHLGTTYRLSTTLADQFLKTAVKA